MLLWEYSHGLHEVLLSLETCVAAGSLNLLNVKATASDQQSTITAALD